MSVIHAKAKDIPVSFDELAPEGVIVARKATYEALASVIADIQVGSAQLKSQRDANWVELQEAKAKLAIIAAGKEKK